MGQEILRSYRIPMPKATWSVLFFTFRIDMLSLTYGVKVPITMLHISQSLA